MFGPNFDTNYSDKIKYNGAFSPEEIVHVITDLKFGLVWDGESINSCTGLMGDYLKLNNPHKTSLYLAAGVPVIVWKEAAMADFIIANNLGITVDSLEDLETKINSISINEYSKMRENAKNFSKKLINGYFTKNSIDKCLKEIEENEI